jgi:hypothetical protein
MNLEDATTVFTKLARDLPNPEMVLRTPRLGEDPNEYAVEIRAVPSKLSELSEFIDRLLRGLNRQTMDLEGTFRVECEGDGEGDGALWLVVTTKWSPADEATEGSPK